MMQGWLPISGTIGGIGKAESLVSPGSEVLLLLLLGYNNLDPFTGRNQLMNRINKASVHRTILRWQLKYNGKEQKLGYITSKTPQIKKIEELMTNIQSRAKENGKGVGDLERVVLR